MSKYNTRYRILELFHEAVGETSELKRAFSKKYGMQIEKVGRYYRNEQKELTHSDAILFLDFFNSKKNIHAPLYKMSDLYVEITHNINLN